MNLQLYPHPTKKLPIHRLEYPLPVRYPPAYTLVKEEKGLQRGQKHNSSAVFTSLVEVLQKKDPHLYEHCARVRYFTHCFLHTVSLSRDEKMNIEFAALFHDIGKLGIDDRILGKTSRLTKQEFERIQEHPALGAALLSQLDGLSNLLPIVLHHHERWDGSGYPGRLEREAIPLGARIVAIADAFEAMTSQARVYALARTPGQALQELCRCAGTQFDPILMEHFSILGGAQSIGPNTHQPRSGNQTV